jgi:glycosyltransferase involved in cell wall biosynthesis
LFRLAFFLPSLAGGGAERVFLDLATGFAARNASVEVVVARPEGELAAGLDEHVSLVSLDAGRTATSLPALVRYLRSARPAAMLTALTHANVLAITARRLARTRTRLVITEHLGPTTWAADAGAARTRLMTTLMRMTYRSADGIVAVSNGVADDVAKTVGLPPDRVSVISNPVILSALEERAREPVDDSWVGAAEPPLLLAVGRLTPQKDFSTLIRAVARVRRSTPCRLLILGEGKERAALERLAADLGIADDVRLPGFVSNPYPYFRHAAVLALSSRFEGLPTVLVEAVCLQVPVVATDCPSGPREILDDGRYGRLVPPGDVEAFADAIVRTLKDEGPRPPAEACERYRLDAVVDQYAAALGAPHLAALAGNTPYRP